MRLRNLFLCLGFIVAFKGQALVADDTYYDACYNECYDTCCEEYCCDDSCCDDSCCDDGCYFEGFYAGIAGGVATNLADITSQTSITFNRPTGLNAQYVTKNSGRIYDYSGWGEVLAGWGGALRCLPSLYAGLRFGVNFSDFDAELKYESFNRLDPNLIVTGVFDTVKVRERITEYTLDVKGGWIPCFSRKSMTYVLLGAAFNNIRIRGASIFDYQDDVDTFLGQLLKANDKRNSVGFRGGVGFEHFLTRCITIHGSYVYTWYGKVDSFARGDTQGSGAPTPDGRTIEYKSVVRRQVAALGLSYYF